MTVEQITDILFDLPTIILGYIETVYRFLLLPITIGDISLRPIAIIGGVGLIGLLIASIIRR